MVGDFALPGHVWGALHRVGGILPVPCGVVGGCDGLIVPVRRHVLVGIVHAEGRAVGVVNRGLRPHDPPASDLHAGIAGGVRAAGLPHVGGERLGCLRPGHGAGVADAPLCHGPGDAIGEVPALFRRGLEGPAANGVAGMAGHGMYGTLGELPPHGPGEPSGKESGLAGAVRGASHAEGAAPEAGAACHVLRGGEPPGGHHQLRHHAAAGVAHVDAQAGQEAVYLLADLQEGDGAQEPDEHVPGGGLPSDCLHVALRYRKDGNGPGEEQGCSRDYHIKSVFHIYLQFLLDPRI